MTNPEHVPADPMDEALDRLFDRIGIRGAALLFLKPLSVLLVMAVLLSIGWLTVIGWFWNWLGKWY